MHEQFQHGNLKIKRNRRCLRLFLIYLSILFIVLILISLVVVPFVFKYSTELHRNIIFPTGLLEHREKRYFQTNKLDGTRNFYLNVDGKDNITLGVWHIIPDELLSEFVTDDAYNYDSILANRNYNILLCLHGNGSDRSMKTELYKILRKFFQIIAYDYRGYADSSPGIMNELTLTDDAVSLYKWIKNQTQARVFIWGHSLGSGVSTQTVSRLADMDMVPAGLVLEAPFTSVIDAVEEHIIVRLYSWLPWYYTTLIQPFIDEHLSFNSTEHIVNVNCPIMLLHAQDDDILPYYMSNKLNATATIDRNVTIQGNVTYHLFEDSLGYGHMLIYKAPELSDYISTFIDTCVEFEKEKIK